MSDTLSPLDALRAKLDALHELDLKLELTATHGRAEITALETALQNAVAITAAQRDQLHAEALAFAKTHLPEILGTRSTLELAGYQITHLPGTFVDCADEKASVQALEDVTATDEISESEFHGVVLEAILTADSHSEFTQSILARFRALGWQIIKGRADAATLLSVSGCLSRKPATLDKAFIKKHFARASAWFQAFGIAVTTERELKLKRLKAEPLTPAAES